MIGQWQVTVHAVKPYTIHGDQYYELHITRPESPEQVLAIRVPAHAINSPPQPGEDLKVTFLMGQVTQAVRS